MVAAARAALSLTLCALLLPEASSLSSVGRAPAHAPVVAARRDAPSTVHSRRDLLGAAAAFGVHCALLRPALAETKIPKTKIDLNEQVRALRPMHKLWVAMIPAVPCIRHSGPAARSWCSSCGSRRRPARRRG